MSARSISKKNGWLTVVNSMDPNEPTEMLIDGFIGESWYDDSGNSGKDFTNALSAVPKGKKVVIKINSEGGVIKDGLAMYDAISARAGDVTANVIGYACSTASWLGLAAGKVISADNAIWMIHNSSSYTYGNADEHRKGAEMLSVHDASIAGMIQAKTGKTLAQVRNDMAAETWFTGKEARDYGLCDDVQAPAPANTLRAAVNVAPWMSKMPDRLKNNLGVAPGSQPTPPSPVDNAAQSQKPDAVTPDISAACVGGEPAGTAASNDTKPNKTSMPDTTNTAAVNPPANDNRISALEAEVQNQKLARLTATANSYVDKGAITKQESALWVSALAKDEAGTVAILDAKIPQTQNGLPGSTVTVVSERPLDVIQKLPTAAVRYATLKKDWGSLMNDALARDDREQRASKYVLNSNTYSSTLITSFLTDGATTVLQNRWAPLMAFTRDFSVDPYKPLATGQHKYVSAGPTVQVGAPSSPITNYESGDATVAPISVTVLEYSSAVHVTSAELNSGLRMENLMTVGVAKLADKIIEAATAPITLANFTTSCFSSNVKAAADFGFAELTTLWGLLQKSPIKNVIMDGTYLAKLLNVPTYFQAYGQSAGAWKAFGWDLIALNSNWTGASNNAAVFACNPQAICTIAGLPINPPSIPGNTLQTGTFQVPEVEMGVQTAQWFSLASRTGWFSWGAMFGAAKMDTSAGVVVCTS